jgi:hypothetical protein
VLPWLGSLAGALLPEPERGAVVRRFGGDPPFASLLIGALEFVGGTGLVHDNAMNHLRAWSDRLATEFLAVAERTALTAEQTVGFTWGGAILWLDWLLRPTSWLLLSLPLVGLLRVTAYFTVREAVAEPAAWAGARLLRLLRRARDAARERAEYGDAAQPDELVAGPLGELIVLTARLRPEWSDAVTIAIGERYYRVAGRDRSYRAGLKRHRYRLVEAPEHEVIRRFLRYEPPATT